jgi:hypothetical protein
VLAHQEDAEAHEQGRQDDPLVGVDPADPDELDIERDHVALERHDRGGDDEAEE